MQLPTELSTMPNVRKYSRSFNADRTKVYREGDQIKIQIPPIQNTYLTKNSKLYFDLNISYKELTLDNANAIYTLIRNGSTTTNAYAMSRGFFGVDYTFNTQFQKLNKPFPTLDINGGYGLIRKIQVHDYLGTTLLEEIPNHDIITASLINMIIKRDEVQDTPPDQILSGRLRNNSCVLPFRSLTSLQSWLSNPFSVNTTVTPSVGITGVNTLTTPTCTFALDMFSFLGLLSSKFVPLHNGFTLSLFVNQKSIPIKFSTGYGNIDALSPLSVPVNKFVDAGSGIPSLSGAADVVILDPSLEDMVLSNVYFKCDLLELPSELDSKVEKNVHTLGYKFQQNFIPQGDNDLSTFVRNRILPSLKSVRKIMIAQRPIQLTANEKLTKQSLGFRLKNYIEKFSLEYNKSVIDKFDNPSEVYSSLKTQFQDINKYIGYDDFTVDEQYSTMGQQVYQFNNLTENTYLSYLLKTQTNAANYSNYWWNYDNSNKVIPHYPPLQGSFLVVFNCSIPGSVPEMISGIDTSSNVLEYTMSSSSRECANVYVDVIIEHDAVIHVDPGKSTSISF